MNTCGCNQQAAQMAKQKSDLVLLTPSALSTDCVWEPARQDAYIVKIMPGNHSPALVIKIRAVLDLAPMTFAGGDMPRNSADCRLLEDISKLLTGVLRLATPNGRMTLT